MEKPIMFRDPRILLTSDTKYIRVDSMKKISSEDLSFNLPSNLEGRNGDWYENEKGEQYYLKRRKYLAIILNELLGEYLSLYMGLETIEYDLAYDGDNIVGLFSKNFRKKGIDYVYYHYLTEDEKKLIDRVLFLRAKTDWAKEYKQQYTDYLMRNFYANQGDKVFNVLCYRDSGLIYLSTLFDYELSFINSEDSYIVDPFIIRDDFDYKLIRKMRKKDECLDESIEKVLKFDMEDTLERIKSDFGIRIPDVVMEHYISYDEERKRLMKENIVGKK